MTRQAIVLAAGLGTRLDPLTRIVAKPAVPVAGRALIIRVLEWLRREGVTQAVLNLHHRPDTITALVGDGRHLGLDVRYSWEGRILESAGGPRHALSIMDVAGDDACLIVNGDTLTDLALEPMVAAHRASGADVTLAAVVPNVARDRYNGVLADAAGRVTGFIPRGHRETSWHFVGVQIARAGVFANLRDGEPAETVSGIYRDLLREPGRVCIWPVDARFHDVGTPGDYLTAVFDIAGADASILEGDVAVSASARLTRSIVWPGARIGAGVSLEDCVVAGAVDVPAGLIAARKVIVPAALAQPGDHADIRDGVALFDLQEPS